MSIQGSGGEGDEQLYSRSRQRSPSPGPDRIRRSSTLPVRFDEERTIQRETMDYEEEYNLRGDRSRKAAAPRPIIINNTYDSPGRHYLRGEGDHGDRPAGRRRRSPSPVVYRERGHSRNTYVSPPRRRTLHRERDYYVTEADLSEDDDEPISESYAFKLSRHITSPLSRENSLGSFSDASEPVLALAALGLSKSPTAGKVLSVSHSKYCGEGVLGGLQSAEMKANDENSHNLQNDSQSIFKWIQIDDITMNLDRFESTCNSAAGTSDLQRAAISRVFGRVRRKYDMPKTAGGSKYSLMVPSVLQEPVAQQYRAKPSERQNIVWMCLPYMALQKYSANISGLTPASHPIRTLMQSRFPQAKKERDMQQAVCHLPDNVPENCFHIAQVWCIVINDSLLITCTRTPIASLLGQHISISKGTEASTELKGHKTRPTNILVIKDKLIWSFPLIECQTWFGFISHFWEYWPEEFEILLHEHLINASDWPNLYDRASKRSTRVSFKLKSRMRRVTRGTPSYVDVPAQSNPPTTSIQGQNPGFANKVQPIAVSSDTKLPGTGKAETQSNLHPEQGSTTPPSVSASRANDVIKSFHVFSWINESQPKTLPVLNREQSASPDFRVDEASLKADLAEMESFLGTKTRSEERMAYLECPLLSRHDIYDILREEERKMFAAEEPISKRRKMYEDMVELVNEAETVFRFFLDACSTAPTVGKFWGALGRLLHAMSREIDISWGSPNDVVAMHVENVLYYRLSTLTKSFKTFVQTFSHASATDRSSLNPLPETLSGAWLHVLMFMIVGSSEEHFGLFDQHFAVCEKMLTQGINKIISDLHKKSLLEYLIFGPSSIASLINFTILGDITGSSADASDIYFEYLASLELAIDTNPLLRSHQDKLTRFKQETQAILENLRTQKSLIETFQAIEGCHPWEGNRLMIDTNEHSQPRATLRSHYQHRGDRTRDTYRVDDADVVGIRSRVQHTYEAPAYIRTNTVAGRPRTLKSELDPVDPNGVQGLLIEDGKGLIEKKIQDFEDMTIRASDLAEENLQKIDNNHDRQENAIFAFTIVTIIFLPLSTVASILGMNVKDVRDLDFNQWVFWATALPLTVVIVALSLMWAGELGNFWTGLWGWGKSGRVVVVNNRKREGDEYISIVER